eukprot:5568065-Prymnesium_polylepis.1
MSCGARVGGATGCDGVRVREGRASLTLAPRAVAPLSVLVHVPVPSVERSTSRSVAWLWSGRVSAALIEALVALSRALREGERAGQSRGHAKTVQPSPPYHAPRRCSPRPSHARRRDSAPREGRVAR